MKRAYISSNGCIEARLDSARLEQFLKMNGWMIVKDHRQADLIVFYACGLTESSSSASVEIIGKFKHEMKPESRLVAWGCLSKIDPQLLSQVYDGPNVGPRDISFFNEIVGETKVSLDQVSANHPISMEPHKVHIHDPTLKFLAQAQRWWLRFSRLREASSTFYISVGRGCMGQCTYCSDLRACGRIRSKPIDKVLSEFRQGLQLGYSRFYLVGTDLGSYGRDIGYALSHLIRDMIKVAEKRKCRIILPNINPFYLKEMFFDMEKIFASKKIELLGCPAESGSNRILEFMRRRYTIEEWKELMRRIKSEFPKILLTTQLMVGFPSETDEDFKATLALLDEVILDDVTIFKFSKRPTVLASRMTRQVPDNIADQRYKKLALKVLFNTTLRETCRRLFH